MKRPTPEMRLARALLVEAIGTISSATSEMYAAERIPGTRKVPDVLARRQIRRNRAWLAKARKVVRS